MSRLSIFFAVVILFTCNLSQAVEPKPALPKAAAFSIRVRIWLTLDFGFMEKDISNSYAGSSICVSPKGYLITNTHVADPGALIAELIAASSPHPRRIKNVLLQYHIENNQKIIFAADFRPEVQYEYRQNAFKLCVIKLDSRPNIGKNRNIHLVKRNTQDTMVIKLDYGTSLPYISLPPILPPLPQAKSQSPEIIYALAARRTPEQDIVTVTRIGQSNGQAIAIVCNTKVKPISMTTLKGDSGSIILDSQNQPVGLLSSHEAPEVSDISFMIPINNVTSFYNSVVKDLSQSKALTQTKRESSNKDKKPRSFIELF